MLRLLRAGVRAILSLAAPLFFSFNLSAQAAPIVSWTSPASGASFMAPASLSLTVDTSDSTSSITSVAFYQGSTLLGTDTSAPYVFKWSNVQSGNYTLTAVATNALGVATTSAAITVEVVGGNGPISYAYDELNRLVGMTDAAGHSATYRYDALGNILSISRATSAQVALSEFSPNLGPVGTAVTIYGSGFSSTPSQNVVSFNQTIAVVTAATANRLIVTVPSGATTGPISVTTPNGTVASDASFTVAPHEAPTIISYTPSSGAADTKITITGTNFSDVLNQNSVKFNHQLATINSATPTSIVSPVPKNVSSGKITVTTAYGIATSSTDFFVAPAPNTIADMELTDRINVGQSKPVTLSVPGKKALILFDGVAGQYLNIGAANLTKTPSQCATSFTVYKPNGSVLANHNNIVAPSDGLDLPALPTTGTYSLLISPAEGCIASMNLVLSQAISGPIAIGGTSVTVTTLPAQDVRLTFNAASGQYLSVGLTNFNTSLNGVVSATGVAMTVLNPNGTILTANSNMPPPSGGLDLPALPVTGMYTIVISPPKGYTASMSVVLSEAIAGTLEIGGSPVNATTAPAQDVRLMFSGTAGQYLSVGLTNLSTYLNGTLSASGNAVSVLKPDGTVLVSNNNIAPPGGGLDLPALPVTGTYTAVISPPKGYTASMTVVLSEAISGTLEIGGAPVSATTTAPVQDVRLTFSGTAGQYLSIGVTNLHTYLNGTESSAASTLTVYKADGTVLATNTFLNPPSGGLDLPALPIAGTYAVVINLPARYTASMSIQLSEAISGILVMSGAPMSATTLPGQDVRLTFSGEAGQYLSLGVTGISTYLDGVQKTAASTLTVYKPDSTVLTKDTFVYPPSDGLDLPVLPFTGTYTVVFNPPAGYTASMNIRLSEAVSGTLGIGGAAVDATTVPGQDVRLSFSGNAGQFLSVGVANLNTYLDGVQSSTASAITVYNADGTILAKNNFMHSPSGELDLPALPATGTYTVVINPPEGNTASMSVILSEAISGTLTPGEAPVSASTASGQDVRLTFSGTALQYFSVGVTDLSKYVNGSHSSVASSLTVYKADGTLLVQNNFVHSPFGGLDLPALPVTDTYTVVFNPREGAAANMSMILSEAISGKLTPGGASVTAVTRPSQDLRLTFSGTAGQNFSIGVVNLNTYLNGTPSSASTHMTIYKPDGSVLAKKNLMSPPGDGLDLPPLPVAGTYTVLINTQDGYTASMEVVLSEALSGGLVEVGGSAVNLTTTTPWQNAILELNGAISQQVTVNFSSNAIGCVSALLRKPDGSTVTSKTSCNASFSLASQTLPVTGTYTISINPSGDLVGTITVTATSP